MAYRDLKDLTRKTASDKLLRDKAFNIANIRNMMDIKEVLLQWIVNSLIKNLRVEQLQTKIKELAEELHKPIIRKFKKRKVQSPFIDHVWGVDLADMQLTSKFDKGICFLLCAIDIFSKYAWVIPLKDKKSIIIITNAFLNILKESNRKLNKIWVDKDTEFCNRSMKS